MRVGSAGGELPSIETRPEPAVPPVREGHAVSGTARLWWWDTGGTRPAIVLLHPATGSGLIWRYQQQAFVNAGFRVIGYSRRGAAGSTKGEPGDRTSALDDLNAVVAAIGLSRFHLLGTAGGAFTAMAFARAMPERLLSLVIANSLLSVTGGEINPMLQNIQLSALQTLPDEVRELGPAYRVSNPAGTARWVELTHGSEVARSSPAGKKMPPGGDGKAGASRPPPPGGMTLEDLRAVRLPVLLIAGDADLLAPPPLMNVFTRYLPNCRMVRLPACGHSGYWEMPALFNETVVGFIRMQGAKR
ncbi:alpha/beta fold hydrolase [Novosphingobium sp. Rr 2-17]|uniref:alpha/beta fold hydrolase n=1 Tax=Novosphingobium sp. Rr 2-17 TaxID=555793 RepID=UPI00063F562F|nr:alpha/beta hydrolase [Novosphingobium sp. Rr 2-17]